MVNIEKSRKERVEEFIFQEEYEKITVKQLAVIFGVPKEDIKYLEKIISELEKEGKIYIDDSKRICKLKKGSQIIGVFEVRANSFGFVRSEDEEIYVAREDFNGALNQDIVLAYVTKQKANSKNAEGVIKKIIKRADLPIVGIFKKGDNFGFVEPIAKGIEDIYIPKKASMGIENNARVIVKIERPAGPNRKAEGKIVEVIGTENTEDIERTLLIKSYQVSEKFPKSVIEEADHVTDTGLGDISSRVDLREDNIYTIDSEDTKDIDDAVSLKKETDGSYKLSVHIADVSHYVKPGSAIDTEAIKRGTSIYMPGFVLPMLPRALSNGICSLNEGEDRLAMSIDIILDESAKVVFSNIYKSVIRSKKKMTYEKVEKVLNNEDDEVLKEYAPFKEDILLMCELAEKLKAARHKAGSIDFDIPESKITLGDNGEVLNVEPYKTGVSNGIIEEFMLVANKCVAKTFYDLHAPFIYRIHEKPDIDVLRELNETLSPMGVSIKGINKVHPKAISDVLEKIKADKKKNAVVSKLILRSLKLAKYSDDCLGHFGLNFTYYTHFTSPIRRYPDLFIHRVISRYIECDYSLPEEELTKLYKHAKAYAASCSASERRATLLERDVDDMYMAKYMHAHLGEEYSGVVSGVNKYGMYVKLESTVEGLVPMVGLEDDYYIYDEKAMRLIGERTKKTYMVGDEVKVQVVRADETSRQIDFRISGGSYEKEKQCNVGRNRRK